MTGNRSPAHQTRLNVVLFQPSADTPSKTQSGENDPASFAEVIVGNLAGRPGIDLMLLGPVNQLNPSSTDALALQLVNGEVVVMTWEPACSLLQTLATVGIEGDRGRHLGDPDAPNDAVQPVNPTKVTRVFYCVDLTQYADVEEVIALLERLRATKSVQVTALSLAQGTVSLPEGSMAKSSRKPSVSKLASMTSDLAEEPSTDPSAPPSREPPTGKRPPSPSPSETHHQHPLDRLIDELDQFDL